LFPKAVHACKHRLLLHFRLLPSANIRTGHEPREFHRQSKTGHMGRLEHRLLASSVVLLISFPMIQSYTPQTDALTPNWTVSDVLSDEKRRMYVRIFV
jgi:hypothetical protein